MTQSTITIDVTLDDQKIPGQITWKATDSSAEDGKLAKAMMLSFWDGADKSALRIDLWTKDMMVDEMGDFIYQTLMTMADSFNRATRQEALAKEMQQYARDFYSRFTKALTTEKKH